MASEVRAYAGQELQLLVCGNTSVTVTCPGLATTVVRGPAGACDNCKNITFAFNNTNTLDYTLTPKGTPCGAFEPTVYTVTQPAGWANGGPSITCVSNCSTNHLVGGDIVLDPVSFMASLQIPDGIGGASHHFCGGTLIMEGVILTAAHCVAGDLDAPGMDALVLARCSDPQCITAVVGAISSSAPMDAPNRLTVVEWVAHPLFDKATFAHDVALLRVSGNYNYSQTQFSLGPWSHEPQDAKVPLNANVAVLGWGITETGSLSPMLRNASMPFVTHTKCAANYAAANLGIAADAVCAGQPYRTDACAGDSGGPLLLLAGNTGAQFGVQVGVVSNGVVSCHSAVGGTEEVPGKPAPGVYASIADPGNSAWLMQQLDQWHAVPAPPVLGRSSTPAPPSAASSSSPSSSNIGVIAGAAGGGCVVAAVVAFFGVRAYRRRRRVAATPAAPPEAPTVVVSGGVPTPAGGVKLRRLML